jgi:hypothetical protein
MAHVLKLRVQNFNFAGQALRCDITHLPDLSQLFPRQKIRHKKEDGVYAVLAVFTRRHCDRPKKVRQSSI